MKLCSIYVNHSLFDNKNRKEYEQLVIFVQKNNLSLQNTFTNFTELFNFLNNEKAAGLVVVYSLKVFGRSSSSCLECVNKIINQPNLNLYVFQDKMHAKNADGTINFNFKTVLDVLGIFSKMEQGKPTCS